jgi:hypothetical protein
LAAGPANDRFAPLRTIIDEALTDGSAAYCVLEVADGLEDRDLQLLGVTRADIAQFFQGYALDGPVFAYRPNMRSSERQVFRLVAQMPADTADSTKLEFPGFSGQVAGFVRVRNLETKGISLLRR